MTPNDIEALKSQLEAEKNKNLLLQSILEQKQADLDKANQDIDHFNNFIVEEIRTHVEEVDKLAKLPEENPSPIFRFSKRGKILIYCNSPGQSLLNEIDNSENSEVQQEWEKALSKIQEHNQAVIYHEIKLLNKVYLVSIIDVKGSNYKNVYATDITNLKKVETALRESEIRYKNVIENASDIVYNTDERGCFTYINPIAERLVGYSSRDLENKLFIELIRDDYKKQTIKFYLNQKINKVRSTYLEFPIVTKNGNSIWIGQNVHLLLENDEIKGFSAIARDITDRVKSQEQLKLLNTQLSSLIQNMYTGILLETNERKIALVNDKFCDLFDIQVPPESLIGQDCQLAAESLKSLFINGDIVLNEIDNILSEKKPKLAQEVKLINGKILERDYIPIFIENKYYGHMWQYKDVTEQRTAQDVLQKSEEKYRRIIQNMNLGLTVVDHQDLILDVNPNFCEITGYQKEEIIGWPANESFLSNEGKKLLSENLNLRKDGKSSAYELEIICKNGEKKWVLISGAPVYDINKIYSGSIGIHLDITERKRNEQLLKEAQLKAESSIHSKEIFLASMSHEIRTPMNAIIGMAELLSDAKLNYKEKTYLDAIKKSSANLLVILNDILDFSKIEAGKLELENYAFSFDELISNLILQFEFKALEKNISITKEMDQKIYPYFWGDYTRINQILTNLLSNSLKFTHEGSVSINCHLENENDDMQLLKFSITDTGIGIDASKLDTIFESFIQEDSSINRKYGGSGLGLSICKQLIALFGGVLKVESEKWKGSTFSFVIPLKKATEGDIEKSIHTTLTDFKINARILLVEDNLMNQIIAQTYLEQAGVQVDKASNGKEALDKISSNTYDLILMDIQMPVMDGFEATKIIRKQKKEIKIIALTANAIKGDKEKYLAAGMNDYLSKPFNKSDLMRKIIDLLPESRSTEHYTNAIRTDKNKERSKGKLYDVSRLADTTPTNDNFIKSMIELFIELAIETNKLFKNTIPNQKDIKLIQSQAHKIKASIDILEIESLKHTVREIEKFDLNNNYQDFTDLCKEFLSNLDAVVKDMKNDYSL
jgi:PAS domain S-box-containing protein